MLFWKDVGNRILLDRPLSFKLHQLPTVTVFYREFNPTLQEIWSCPAKCIPLASSCKYLAKMCGDDGDDLNTTVGISLPQWCGNAVIVTALVTLTLYDSHTTQTVSRYFGVHFPCSISLITRSPVANYTHYITLTQILLKSLSIV